MNAVILISMLLFFVFGASTAGWFVGLALAVMIAPLAYYLLLGGVLVAANAAKVDEQNNSVNEVNNQTEITDAMRVAAEENGYSHISSSWTDNSLKARIQRANERAKS